MLLLALLACNGSSSITRVEPSFLQVTLQTDVTGTPEAPLPFTHVNSTPNRVEVPVSVQALNIDGEPASFTGDLRIKIRPGTFLDVTPEGGSASPVDQVHIEGGQGTFTLAYRGAFGPARIWFLDEGDRAETGRTPSYASGVSAPIYYNLPTIAELQSTDESDSNALYGEFAELRIAERQVVVTSTSTSGFWVSDLSDDPASGNYLFVYTFNRPREEIVPGAKLTLLTGAVQEYLATTQLSHPTYVVEEGTTLPVPAPLVLDATTACNPDAMELREGAMGRVEGGVIPAGFMEDADLSDKFLNYNEWPINIGDCQLLVISKGPAPEFYPPDYAGATLPSLQGMLKEIHGDWILEVVNRDDIALPSSRPVSPRR